MTESKAEAPTSTRPPRSFFAVDAATLAPRLLGCALVRILPDGTRLSGLIVEAEAYLGPQDRASHAVGGRRTSRNEAMFAQPGTSYVYLTYGMHWMVNVAALREGHPAAVLIRAVQPLDGLEVMRRLRREGSTAARITDRDLCRGPGRVCQAMAITREQNALDLTTDSTLFILTPSASGEHTRDLRITRTPRIGVEPSGPVWSKRLLRYLLTNSPFASGTPAQNRVRRESRR